MDTHLRHTIRRAACSTVVAVASAAGFTLVWIARNLSHETRDFVSFVAFVVFVVAFNEAAECFHRCRRQRRGEGAPHA